MTNLNGEISSLGLSGMPRHSYLFSYPSRLRMLYCSSLNDQPFALSNRCPFAAQAPGDVGR